MKIGVSLYSFHGYSAADSLGIKGCIDKAKEFGCEGVDFVEFGNGLTHEEYLALAKEYGDYCKQVGIEAVCFCVGSDFLNRDLDEEIARVKKLVDIAVALGAKCMRHDATPGYPASVKTGRSFDAVLPILTKAYREVTEYAKTVGIKTCIENHGFFAQDPERVEKLINAVNHPNYGWLIDMGNFTCADENPAISVGIAAPYAFYVHAKDFIIKPADGPNPGKFFFQSRNGNYLRGTIVGQGNVPVKHCLIALKKAGYDGYVAIEFEGMEDCLLALEAGCENLKRYIAEIEG